MATESNNAINDEILSKVEAMPESYCPKGFLAFLLKGPMSANPNELLSLGLERSLEKRKSIFLYVDNSVVNINSSTPVGGRSCRK